MGRVRAFLPHAPQNSIIPHLSFFVKRKVEQILITNRPKLCAIFYLTFAKIFDNIIIETRKRAREREENNMEIDYYLKSLGIMKIKDKCVFCNKNSWEVFVKAKDVDRYINEGVLVQNAFPYLTPTERECIISGICPTCQDKIFG